MDSPADEGALEQLLAESMDAPLELLGLLPQLLADLEDLGARSGDVIDILAQLPDSSLRAGSRVLDLGCGKGAAAIAIAQARGAHVVGIDGLAAFVEHASARAAQLGLSSLCRFERGDIRKHLEQQEQQGDRDLVMLLALGDVLGDTAETLGRLRDCVRPGGHILIDDAYLRADVDDPELQAIYDFHDGTSAALQSWGDTIVAQRIVDGPQSAAYYHDMTAKITDRAEQLAQTRPELAPLIREFASRQRSEVALLDGPVIGSLWLVQRN